MNASKLKASLRLPAVLVALMAVLTIVSPRFLTISNLSNVLWSICVISILASGAIYAPITGGIDLSIGSIAALTGIVVDILMNRVGLNWLVAIFLTVLLGAFIGLFNGVITTKFKVNAFIVTMAAKTYLYGIAMIISQGGMKSILKPAPFLVLGGGRTFGLPNPIYIMILFIVASHLLLTRSSFGRRTIAVGALIGAIMVAFIGNALNLLNVPAPYHPTATGIVILLALILNLGVSPRRRASAGGKHLRRTA